MDAPDAFSSELEAQLEALQVKVEQLREAVRLGRRVAKSVLVQEEHGWCGDGDCGFCEDARLALRAAEESGD